MQALPVALTLSEATPCAALLRVAVAQESGSQVVVDASALLRFDSAALAVLLDCRRAALAASKTFAVRGMAPRLHELAVLYGVEALLPAP
jgi:phospholipid transport system transporter-binding protein